MYRVVLLDFTPEIEVFNRLFDRCHSRNTRKSSIKQHREYFNFLCKIPLCIVLSLNARTRVGDPASWLSLATGMKSRNLRIHLLAWYCIPFKEKWDDRLTALSWRTSPLASFSCFLTSFSFLSAAATLEVESSDSVDLLGLRLCLSTWGTPIHCVTRIVLGFSCFLICNLKLNQCWVH